MLQRLGETQILQAETRAKILEIELDRSTREAYIDGIPMALGAGEYALLCEFASYARKKRRPTATNLAELMREYHVAD